MYQWDVLNGTYRVHVEAAGYEPKNSYAVTVPPTVTDLHVGLARAPSANYIIFKSVIDPDPTGNCIINRAEDKVPYRIVVKNEGEVNLTNVTVSDTLISPLPDLTGDDADPGVLNTGETWTYTGNYMVTQEDIDRAIGGNATIENMATVSCNQLSEENSSLELPIIYVPPNVLTPEPENSTVPSVTNSSTNVSSGNIVGSVDNIVGSVDNIVGSGDNSGGGNSEGKAVIVRNDANSSSANTAAPANVSPTENDTSNVGHSSTPANVEPTPVQTTTTTPVKESKKTPGFELLFGITGLLGAVYLYKKTKI